MTKLPDIEPYTPSLAADLDVFRRVLMRRLVNHQQGWRRCRKPACRRQHSCLGDSTICVREGRPAPVFSAEEEAQGRRELQMAIKKRLAEFEAPSLQQQDDKEEDRRSTRDRSRTGKSGRAAHRKKTDGAP